MNLQRITAALTEPGIVTREDLDALTNEQLFDLTAALDNWRQLAELRLLERMNAKQEALPL